MKSHPPKLAQKLFRAIAGNAHIDDMLSDMDEWFYNNVESRGTSYAK